MRRAAAAAALAVLLTTSACSGSGSGSGSASGAVEPGATVDMVFTEFTPTDVRIKAGQTLTFVNANPITHVIVQGSWTAGADDLRSAEKDDGTFSLKVSKKDQRVEHTFTQAGTFQFFCTIHKGMNGTVTVA